ncbi:formate dehydrogenase subunit delta [Glaciimonas sp. CA11.2]|uniref:formate dehydrogenase subunit delta n=1 Tax=unclassified Glaciimonas TaxID=2644401 RepID=UPI002AB3A132|nr:MULTISPECIES: formate dehydrogenase subunit delta [unclassified Glaciimonas]MDY7545201.1 formate dehydrogenase subunit delta [Glaciimonas sp. CA11.2]MEB0011301.1 formate dehydrogenase subunit delta [Glaciimonas sp. Cout2]MEB0080951.1 formate dehydrogenase subunit delta [Glaciimonas sp. Gout2]MEB0162446.1 formate dehydrogenase subunit delta [Glaciimonas sp. CA11.2]
MNVHHLIKMANQIGSFFETMPNRPQAMTDFAMHIKRSWEPRMRSALLKYADEQEENELTDMVRQSIREHADAMR